MTSDSPQSAHATLSAGENVELDVDARLTTRGLLAIAALVCGILLSTSVLVATATRRGAGAARE